jgi:hypothetical protein
LDERKLIGTWQQSSMDAAWRITFKSDHTLIAELEDLDSHKFESPIFGSWNLNASRLTTDLDLGSLQVSRHQEPDHQKKTETIKFVGNDEIESDIGPNYTRLK